MTLPGSLTEYVSVYAGDLLQPLSREQTRNLWGALSIGYGGGPWPRRAQIQRLVEIIQRTADIEAVIGELLIVHAGGVESALSRLSDPQLHDAAVTQLAQLPGTGDLVAHIRKARNDEIVTDTELAFILRTSLGRVPLPELSPVPAPLEPIPDDYPESQAHATARDPGFHIMGLSDVQQHALADLQAERDGGHITFAVWRERAGEIIRDRAHPDTT